MAPKRTFISLERLNSAAPRLSPRHVEILAALAGGSTYSQIGAAFTLPPGTVRSRISRARDAFEALRIPDTVSPPHNQEGQRDGTTQS